MTELHSSVFLVMISGQIESGTVSKGSLVKLFS